MKVIDPAITAQAVVHIIMTDNQTHPTDWRFVPAAVHNDHALRHVLQWNAEKHGAAPNRREPPMARHMPTGNGRGGGRMTIEEFTALVEEMRNLQKMYFRTRSPNLLDAARESERKVDLAIEGIRNPSLLHE